MEEENNTILSRVLYAAQVVVLLYSGATAVKGLGQMGADAGGAIHDFIEKRREKNKNDPNLKIVE